MTKKKCIARRAWSLYRATVTVFPADRTRATISACFRAAWAPSARAEWDALNAGDGAGALEALVRMTWKVKARAEAAGMPWADWVKTPEDAQSAAGEAWTRLPAILDRAEAAGDELPLAIILYRAAAAAVRWIYRAEHVGVNSEKYDPSYSRHSPDARTDPEQAAIIRDAINRAALTAEDRAIITATVRGFTIRQIAEMTATSKSTVQRRLDAIRARLKQELAQELAIIQKGA